MADFTLKHYSDTLELALAKGYRFTPLKEHKVDHKKHIILRHDIDFTLENAKRMAEIEADLSIRSTYFVRLHAKNYHPFTLDNFKILDYILSEGHEIGLHFEPDFYKQFGLDPIKYFNNEVKALENILMTKVHGAATHEPARCGYLITEDNIKETTLDYEAYLIKGFKYISDSGARWREGSMHEWISEDKADKLYVNTHPLWWFDKTPLENY